MSALLEGVRVMVIEDDPIIGLDLQDQLESLGARVIGPVSRMSDALERIAAEEPIDCATLDVSLADDLVFPVADELRKRGIPFVFVTSYSRLVLPPKFREIPCCVKPFDGRHVAAALSAYA